MQQLFVSHANVFDESMQNYFIQNFIHEAECAKTFRAAVRRTSLVRRCLLAMYPAEKGKNNSSSSSTPTGKNRWSASLVARAVQHKRNNSLEVCPEVDNPVVIEVVKTELLKISSWDFNVFVVRTLLSKVSISVGNLKLRMLRVVSFYLSVDRRCRPGPDAEHRGQRAAGEVRLLLPLPLVAGPLAPLPEAVSEPYQDGLLVLSGH